MLAQDRVSWPAAKKFLHLTLCEARSLSGKGFRIYWVAVKELKLSYYIGETLLFTIYTHYGNLI